MADGTSVWGTWDGWTWNGWQRAPSLTWDSLCAQVPIGGCGRDGV